MKRKKIVTRICAWLLAASLAAADASPAFAAAAPQGPEAGGVQAMEENVSGEGTGSAGDTQPQSKAMPEGPEAAPQETGKPEAAPQETRKPEAEPQETGKPEAEPQEAGQPDAVQEEPEDGQGLPDAAQEETALPEGTKEGQELPDAAQEGALPEGAGEGQGILDTLEEGTEILDGTDPRPETFSTPEPREGQETGTGIEVKSDGLVYLDGVLFTGYYMDASGILYSVDKGAAKPLAGTVKAGTEYYSCMENKVAVLEKQAVFVEGKAYTGYYMDSDGLLYLVTDGAAEPYTGAAAAGAEYYSYSGSKTMSFPGQAVFVAGKAYIGYYMGSDGLFCLVANGAPELYTGAVGQGTEYYSFSGKTAVALPAETVFVEGKIYTGYYMDAKKKLYYIKKGAPTLKTGLLKAGVKYYSYSAKQVQATEKQALYVEGSVYTGYYMSQGNKLYSVKKGVRTLKTGSVKAKTKYYSYNEKKMLALKKQTLYVKGSVYTGYYMSQKNKMYYVKKGTSALKTGSVKAGVKYYSYKYKKTRKLPKQTLYVKGNVYTGYYMSQSNKMYYVKKGTSTLKTGSVKAGVKYYSYKYKKTRKLPKQTLYVKGKAYTGYYLNQGNTMYQSQKGTCAPVTGMLPAGTKYYSYNGGKTLTLAEQALYVEGQVYTGYYMDAERKMYRIDGGRLTPVTATLDAGTAYYSAQEGNMQALPAQAVYVNGKAMEGMSPASLETLLRAQAVVAGITNDSMSKEQKLRVCFDYVKSAYTEINPRIPHYRGLDWPVVYANDMFVNGSGNCCSYAAAFAYMAKAIGYDEVYCCNSGGHGWAEIDGLVYDPEWSKWHHVYNYFALSYNTPTDQDYKGAIGAKLPWMRIKI